MLRPSVLSGEGAFNLVVAMLRDHKIETLNEFMIAGDKLTTKQVKESIANPKFLAELIDGERGLRKKLQDLAAKHSAAETDPNAEFNTAEKLAALQQEFIDVLDFCFRQGLNAEQEYKKGISLVEVIIKEFALPEVAEKLLSQGAPRSTFTEALKGLTDSLKYNHSNDFAFRVALNPENFPLSVRVGDDIPFQKFEALRAKYPVQVLSA